MDAEEEALVQAACDARGSKLFSLFRISGGGGAAGRGRIGFHRHQRGKRQLRPEQLRRKDCGLPGGDRGPSTFFDHRRLCRWTLAHPAVRSLPAGVAGIRAGHEGAAGGGPGTGWSRAGVHRQAAGPGSFSQFRCAHQGGHVMNILEIIEAKKQGLELSSRTDSPRGDRVHRGDFSGVSDVGFSHGCVVPGHDPPGNRRLDRSHAGVGRAAGHQWPGRPHGRQAQHRGSGRQGEPAAGATGGCLRVEGAHALGPGPGTHRGHPGQAGSHPRVPDPPGQLGVPGNRPGQGVCHHGAERIHCSGRWKNLRPARRHGDRGLRAPDHGFHHVQEAGGRTAGPSSST